MFPSHDNGVGEKLKHFKGGYNWLRHKAGFFCADMFIDYGEINEIVQQTIEVMLYNLEAIPYLHQPTLQLREDKQL